MAVASTEVVYEPLGAALDLFHRRDPEVVLSGPAGTGKSLACLHKLHLAAQKYPGMRGLMFRKHRVDVVGAAVVTFEQRVLHALDGVKFVGAGGNHEAQYTYPNGSVIVVGGLDKDTKILSREYDLAYGQELTELAEGDLETVTTRLRYGVMPYQQFIGDCNPSGPSHWLKLRADRGQTVMLESRHEDNPTIWDRALADWTPHGRAYIAKLDALTGVRKARLRFGHWAAAEGLVYDGWDPALHLVEPFAIPADWPRLWVVDFGYSNPFVWQAWARDPDGRLFRYREIYMSRRLVEDHARQIRELVADEPRPRAIICDHDAEDRATLERHLGLSTTAAKKTVSDGIQAVASRLKPAGDGKPRLFLVRGALAERDAELEEAKKPTSTEQEVEAYVWPTPRSTDRPTDEAPVKKDDHGMDAMRYVVAHEDLRPSAPYSGWEDDV